MAKTTREKPGPKMQNITGPMLVQEENEPTPPPESTDSEKEVGESEETAPPAAAEAHIGKDPRTIPRIHGEMPANELLSFIAAHPSPMDLDAYFYRLKPKIRRMKPPDWPEGKKFPSYVAKLKGLITDRTKRVFDLEWLLTMQGSGKYKVQINDRSTRTRNVELCHCFIEINDYDNHPPIFEDWSELIPCDENKWFIEQMLRDKVIKRTPEGNFVAYEHGPQEAPSNGSIPSPGEMLKQTVDLAKDLARTMQPKESPSAFSGKDIVDLIKSQAAQNDPQKVIDAAKGLVEISRPPAAPPAPPPDNTILTFVLERLSASEERNAKLLDQLLTRANTPPPAPPAPADPEVQLSKTFDLLTKAKEFMGEGGASSKMNGWQEFLKEPLTELINLAKPFAQLGAQVLAIRAAQSQPAATAPPAPRPAPRPTADQIGSAADQPAAAPAPTAEPAQEPAAAPPPPDAAFQGVMVVIGAVLQQIDLTLRSHFAHFAAGDEGYSGEDFAAYFCDQQIGLPSPWNLMAPDGISGAEALIRIRQFSATDNQGNIVPAPEAGRRIILESYQHNPATWQALCPTEERAKLFDQFIAEFLNYDPEGEAEPAAPPAKGARK